MTNDEGGMTNQIKMFELVNVELMRRRICKVNPGQAHGANWIWLGRGFVGWCLIGLRGRWAS